MWPGETQGPDLKIPKAGAPAQRHVALPKRKCSSLRVTKWASATWGAVGRSRCIVWPAPSLAGLKNAWHVNFDLRPPLLKLAFSRRLQMASGGEERIGR